MSENKVYRTALIGCGNISQNHLLALSALENVEIVALCDVRPERAEHRRDEFAKNAAIYTDWKQMLKEAHPDAVHILTPHYLHAEMAIYALSLDIHVLLEKPAAVSFQEADQLLAAEKASKGRITVCFQNRLLPAMQEMKRRVECYGPPLGGRAMVSWYRDSVYYSDEWHGKKALECGGVVINQAIHTLDLLLWYCGRPTAVWASIANRHLPGKIEVEDSCDALLSFESGIRGHFSATTAYVTDSPNFVEVLCRDHRLHLYGSELYDNGERIPLQEATVTRCGKSCYGDGHTLLITAFYEALRTGGELPVTLESALYSVRTFSGFYLSNNQKIEINCK